MVDFFSAVEIKGNISFLAEMVTGQWPSYWFDKMRVAPPMQYRDMGQRSKVKLT